jgi:hypothetical protein
METYRHSGAISLSGILLASTVGIAVAIVLGVFYSFATVHIPYTKINIVLTGFFGMAMGYAVGWGAKIGKVRNTFVASAYGFIIGLIGLYVAWGTDFIARDFIPNGDTDYLMAYSPSELMEYIKWFYENGAWSMSRGGKTVTGIELGTIWAVEAATIVGFSTLFARKFILNHPFCENCNCWTIIKPGERRLSIVGMDEYLERLFSGNLTSLKHFRLAENDTLVMSLDLATCPRCKETCYLTIKKVTISPDKEGNPQENSTPIVQNMLIPPEFVPLVKDAGISISREWKR